MFLVKWSGYHRNESTWEPECHLSPELINSYLCPPVDRPRLEAAAYDFECAIQKRLSTRSSSVILNIDLDIYRHVFETDKPVLVENKDKLNKLPLCENWNYKLESCGRGVCISFPFRVSPRLFNRAYIYIYIYIYEPWHGISNNVVCATSKASDQPAHTRSLIRAFAS